MLQLVSSFVEPSLISTHVAGQQLEHVLSICEPKWVLAGSEHVSTLSEPVG